MADIIRQAVGRKCPSQTELVRVGGDVQWAGWRVSGRRAPSGWEWQGAQSCQGATELVFPGPTLWQMQSEPPGHREEASSQGLGGDHVLAQTDARRPACQVVGDHLDGQPGPLRHSQDWRRSGPRGDGCQGRRKTVPLGRRKAGPLGRCLTALAGLGRAWRGGAPALTAVRFSHLWGANRRLAGPATPPPPQPPGGCL